MPRAIQELISTMRFPLGGIDLTQKPSGQRPGTTAVGTNVRGTEPIEGRDRGGSRPGIAKYIDEQVSGDHYIQHLNYIVTASGEAVGSGFDDIDLGDIGGLGVDNFGGLTPNEFSGWGGGGYQPALPRKPFRLILAITGVTLAPQPGSTATFTPKTARVPANGSTVTIVATLRNFAGDPQAAETIVLHTTPPGRPGDGDSGVTIFDLGDPPHGTVTFTVSDTNIETVVYSASDTTNPLNSVNTVSVSYRGVQRPLLKSNKLTAPNDGSDVVLTVTLTNDNGSPRAGNTIRLNTDPPGKTGDTDTQVTNASGMATFTVNETDAGVVTYTATNTSDTPNTVSAPVAVSYGETENFIILITAAVATFGGPPNGQGSLRLALNGPDMDHWDVANEGEQASKAYRTDPTILVSEAFLLDGVNIGNVASFTNFQEIDRSLFVPGENLLQISCPSYPPTSIGHGGIIIHKVVFSGGEWVIDTTLLSFNDAGLRAEGISQFAPPGFNPQLFPFIVP